MPRTKTVEVLVVNSDDVLKAMADAGVTLSDAEQALLAARVEAGSDPVAAFEVLLDERVGPACRSQFDYPQVAVTVGVAPAAPAVSVEAEVEVSTDE